jgi:hypothetical protein
MYNQGLQERSKRREYGAIRFESVYLVVDLGYGQGSIFALKFKALKYSIKRLTIPDKFASFYPKVLAARINNFDIPTK